MKEQIEIEGNFKIIEFKQLFMTMNHYYKFITAQLQGSQTPGAIPVDH